ncbi:MAG: cytochrome P450 [Myxococcales bacterium]|nr:cytochrome P450 [Myxococcales bacterium]MCB9751329.1 cytochrome P450 [Myxococcales bacterium]
MTSSRPTIDFDPFTPPHLIDATELLARARRETPVFYSPPLGTWVITRYDDIVEIMRDPASFSSAAAITNVPAPPPAPILEVLARGVAYEPNSVDLDPPGHTVTRKFITRAFSSRRVSAMEPRITEFAHELVDRFSDGEADLVAEFAYPLPTLVIAEILGVPTRDLPDFKRWSDEWIVLLAQRGDMPRLIAAAEAIVEFQLYVAAMIRARREAPRDDLTSAVVAAADELDAPPSDALLTSLLMTVMFAGHETTTSLLTNTVKLLSQHPEARREVLASRELVPAAIHEALRFDPPVPSMYRTATRDVELGGVTIPAGAHIQLNFASANRDERYFEAPDVFDIHRAERVRPLSFGHGIHHCVGAALASLEGRVALNVLYDRLPGLRLKPGQVITPIPSATVRGTKQLLVVYDGRRPREERG